MPVTTQSLKEAELLGTDIGLDGYGNFGIQYRNGFRDLATIAGRSNLTQALLNRLRAVPKRLASRLAGSLPLHPDYGVAILSTVSAPYSEVLQQTQALIASNFAAEPRLKPMQSSDITFTWDSSKRLLEIKITYSIITSEIPQNLIFPIYIT